MHLVDITMFYAPEGGGVSTYLNAKARWLAQRQRVRHTILSPNLRDAPSVGELFGASAGRTAATVASASMVKASPLAARAGTGEVSPGMSGGPADDDAAQFAGVGAGGVGRKPATAGASGKTPLRNAVPPARTNDPSAPGGESESTGVVGAADGIAGPHASAARASMLVRLPGLSLPGLHGYRLPWSVRSAARSIEALQPDLVEAGDAAHAAWAALRVRRRLRIPAVAFYHSDLPRLVHERLGSLASAAARRYLRHLYRQFDLVLAPSRRMVEQLASMGVEGAVHQPLGIDTAIFTPGRRIDALRQHLRLAPDTRLLVFAGRFTPEKRLPLLLDAVRKLGPRYHLLLIGSGAALPHAAHTTQLPFLRDQASLAHLLASCDMLVHPGDCETFGLIVLEAMACGLPVVATSSGGVAELVDASSGILAPPGSVDALCGAIEAMYGGDLAAMSQAAAGRVRRLYDWNIIMPQLMQRYAGLLAARERGDLEVEPICATE